MDFNRRVVITGLGVITSIGIGKDEFWKNLVAGKSGISEVSAFDTSDHFTHRGGEVKNFNPGDFIEKDKISTINRATQLAFSATKLALTDSNLNIIGKHDIALCMGTTMGSIHTVEYIDELLVEQRDVDKNLFSQIPTNTTSSFISHYYNLQGQSIVFSTACSAGNYAIGYGSDLIRLGKANVALVGGYDAFLRVAFTGFNQFSAVAQEKCQPFDKNRSGMMVSEGAGVLILESLEHAIDRGADIYGEISGYDLSCDAHHMTTPAVDSIATCMEKAIKGANISPDDIDYISAHGTGTPANDKTECAAVKKVFGERYKNIPISSIKSMIGHTMGAASAIEANACALAVKNDVIPPTINYETPDTDCDVDCVPNSARELDVTFALNNSYAFGGNNASVVIKKYFS